MGIYGQESSIYNQFSTLSRASISTAGDVHRLSVYCDYGEFRRSEEKRKKASPALIGREYF